MCVCVCGYPPLFTLLHFLCSGLVVLPLLLLVLLSFMLPLLFVSFILWLLLCTHALLLSPMLVLSMFVMRLYSCVLCMLMHLLLLLLLPLPVFGIVGVTCVTVDMLVFLWLTVLSMVLYMSMSLPGFVAVVCNFVVVCL